MVVTRPAKPSVPRQKRTGPKQKQISQKVTSKWKCLPDDLKNVAMVMFEDATNRCKHSGDEDVQELLSRLKESFQQTLSALRVPDKPLVAEKDIQKHLDWLQAENARLHRLENNLTEALNLHRSKADKLQTKADQLRVAANENVGDDERNTEIHPILKKVLGEAEQL